MPIYNGERKIKKIFLGGVKIKRVYLGGHKVWSGATLVTYHVDTGVSYQEDVDEGESVLDPTTFTPTKTGYIFHGWREDDTASSTVLPSKTASGDTMDLYAVFKKVVTVTYYNNSSTASNTSDYIYYNNNNSVDPSFTLTCATVSGWDIRGWSTSSGASAAINYNSGVAFTQNSDVTLYASWSKTVTVSYNGNGATGGSTGNQTGTAYRGYKGDVTGATFTLSANGYTRTNYSFTGKWAEGSASGTQYTVGTSRTLSANTTYYACWRANEQTIPINNLSGRTTAHEGTHSDSSNLDGVISIYAHTASNPNTYIAAITGNISSQGYSKVKISYSFNAWGSPNNIWYGDFYANGTYINHVALSEDEPGSISHSKSGTYTFAFSGSNPMSIMIKLTADESSNCHMTASITAVTLCD